MFLSKSLKIYSSNVFCCYITILFDKCYSWLVVLMILTHHHSLPIMYLFHASIHIHLDLPDLRGDLARDISSSSLVHCKMLVEAFPPSSFVFLVFVCWGVVGVLRVKLMFYSVRANVKDIGYNSVDQSSLATPILARTQSNV